MPLRNPQSTSAAVAQMMFQKVEKSPASRNSTAAVERRLNWRRLASCQSLRRRPVAKSSLGAEFQPEESAKPTSHKLNDLFSHAYSHHDDWHCPPNILKATFIVLVNKALYDNLKCKIDGNHMSEWVKWRPYSLWKGKKGATCWWPVTALEIGCLTLKRVLYTIRSFILQHYCRSCSTPWTLSNGPWGIAGAKHALNLLSHPCWRSTLLPRHHIYTLYWKIYQTNVFSFNCSCLLL